jgi:hypothetical protein
VLDGPPAWRPEPERARYPALPVLAYWLTADATVVLDDLPRPGELAVPDRWEAQTP